MAEREQKREAIVGIDPERSGLRVAQPALGHQIVEEGVEAIFADKR
jgi:acetaldehyde dehydrogenase (acetylating)